MSIACTSGRSVATRFPQGVDPLKYSPPEESSGLVSTSCHSGLKVLLVWLKTMSMSTARPRACAVSISWRKSSGAPKSRSTVMNSDGSYPRLVGPCWLGTSASGIRDNAETPSRSKYPRASRSVTPAKRALAAGVDIRIALREAGDRQLVQHQVGWVGCPPAVVCPCEVGRIDHDRIVTREICVEAPAVRVDTVAELTALIVTWHATDDEKPV